MKTRQKLMHFWLFTTLFLGHSIMSNAQQNLSIQIPGIIEAENYNAYFDTDNINEGGVYKNDGVDIEICEEGGFNVGWTSTGEYLKYNVFINETGNYTFAFRIAALENGGQFHLEANGVSISEVVTVPSTGGWQNWNSISISNIALNQGENEITFFIDQGDFNFNHITTSLQSEDDPQLVWSDEFNYTGLPDPSKWGYDTGNGGFGNNELQNYTASRLENARVEDGRLIIEARRDWHQNIEYSSARMVTRNKGDWLYGRVEVRAKLPGPGNGTWPAIWMLPTDWEYGGWPNSGEIDIMENVGYDPHVVHGTVHTEAYNHRLNTQLAGKVEKYNYNTEFHIYAINWYEDKIDFFIDDELYFTHFKHGGSAEWPFDKRFHLILNIAVGGDWGGALGVDSSIWPKRMEVDYVRVYDKPTSTSTEVEAVNIPGTVEAENYYLSEGIQKESSSEGGQNIGYIDTGDWAAYKINVLEAGNYLVEYRVASNTDGGIINLEQNSGNTLLGSVNVPNTGGWQNWQTISHSVQLNTGEQTFAIGVPTGGYNVNWIRFTKDEIEIPVLDPIHIEAESFVRMEGIQTEPCSEGGENIGWTDRDDWIVYEANIPAGNYQVNYRIASQNDGGELQLEKAGGGTLFSNTIIPSTGGWQNWQTISTEVTIPEELDEIAINIREGGFNLNWLSLTPLQSNGRRKFVQLEKELTIYPNPAHDFIKISYQDRIDKLEIYTINGQKEIELFNTNKIEINTLSKGLYILKIMDKEGNHFTKKFIKK